TAGNSCVRYVCHRLRPSTGSSERQSVYMLYWPPIGITTLTCLSAKKSRTPVLLNHEIPSEPPPIPVRRKKVGACPPDAGEMTSLAAQRSIDGEYTSMRVMRDSAEAGPGCNSTVDVTLAERRRNTTPSARSTVAHRRTSNG